MKITNQIENQINNVDFDYYMKQNLENGLILSQEEIDILEKYQINYRGISTVKQLIFEIEECLDEVNECDDLEWLSQNISEQDYYQNTNK